MQTPTDDNSIMLVGSAPLSGAPTSAVNDATQALRECTGEVVVFFHGSGVDHATAAHSGPWLALSGLSRLKLEVCSAAWQRRHARTPPAPFVVSSLVRFWHRVAKGYRIVGQAGCASRNTALDSPWVIRIDSRPAEPDSREVLEVVLAGASLELPIAVVFTGEGRRHLIGGQVRQWRQLVDFELARCHVLAGDDFKSEFPAETIDDEGLGRLVAQGRGVLVL
jgi:hypothetical protein